MKLIDKIRHLTIEPDRRQITSQKLSLNSESNINHRLA